MRADHLKGCYVLSVSVIVTLELEPMRESKSNHREGRQPYGGETISTGGDTYPVRGHQPCRGHQPVRDTQDYSPEGAIGCASGGGD